MRRWGLLVTLLAALAAGGLSSGAPARVAVAPTFNLVTSPKCGTGEKNVGRACVNPNAVLADKWTYGDGNAKWDIPGQWVTTYDWTIPATVPAAGANLTMKLGGTERIGGANNRICPAMGAVSGFGLQGAQPQTLGFCAEAGGTVSQSKTLKMVASSAQPAGSLLYLTIGLQDGPRFTYTYKGAKKKASCRRFSGAAEAAGALECDHPVAFIATYGGRPAGSPTRVLDVRIAGQGAGTLSEEFNDLGDPTGELELDLKFTRVVLERDYFTNSGDRETQRLVFARPAEEDFRGTPPGKTSIKAFLRLVASNDPACGDPRGPNERTAYLLFVDRGNTKTEDAIALYVKGCKHHQYLVKGQNRVKVAISVK